MGNAPFVEASRRNWKGGGAVNGKERGVGTEERPFSGSFLQELEGGRSSKRGGARRWNPGIKGRTRRQVGMHWWFRLVFRGRRVECRRGGALGLVFVELFLSSRRCLLSGRQVVWVVCGGPGRGAKDADGRRRLPALPRSLRTREESAGESSPTVAPRGCR